jgi:uncharacterized LabA/DUF88 family protein
VSKNVAVFVDVANIFYAAKAAGVDIDYVTLLKAATAGRDFVRAYAYTGLDPENENQRQFHSFLARSGYKVISKDIRKYGDGRIKANLDIELVVDLMKTARNLDIAVVVSGDGDFASAIRAVQEMGVRVEVISFRGNTSSDLIDVADQFTDIASIARVEKGSVRSGRRVAAEGDLSMTAVPEKETEGAPRRRGGRGRPVEERVAVSAAASAEREAAPSNVIALPGERLSRGAAAVAADGGEDEEEAGFGGEAAGPESDEARRRRRRRGGRGRGRGRRGEEGMPGEELAGVATAGPAEDEEFDEPQPAQLPHHTFGSVWDSQIGVPSAGMPPMDTLAGEPSDEEDFDEPEVPEYLLAERRQRGQGGGGRGGRQGGGRNRSAYQAALDRERFGRSPTPQPSFGGSGGGGGRRGPERGPDRGRDRGRGGRPQGGRPPRYEERAPMMESRGSSEPWSEVPPELEQMLRAELSRKQPEPMATTAAPRGPVAEPMEAAEPMQAAEAEAPAKPTRARTSTRTRAAKAPADAAEAPSEAEAPVKATRTRTTKVAATKPATRTRKAAAADGEAAPKKTTTRRKTAAKSEPAAETAAEATEG